MKAAHQNSNTHQIPFSYHVEEDAGNLIITFFGHSTSFINLNEIVGFQQPQKITLILQDYASVNIQEIASIWPCDQAMEHEKKHIAFHLKPMAKLQFVYVQQNPVSWQTTYEFILEQSASLQTNLFFLADGASQFNLTISLQGKDAQADVKGLYFLDAKENVNIISHQQHYAPYTQSSVAIRGIVNGQAVANYEGLIYIAQDAQHAVAHQENKNILLSAQAKAFSKPSLEVLTDQVQCKHGSAIGRLDSKQLFYLASRGIDEKIGKKMLLMAFIRPALESIDAATRDNIAQIINSKWA